MAHLLSYKYYDNSGKLIAQETLFGWIILGPVFQEPTPKNHFLHTSTNDSLLDLLTNCKLWTLEEVPADLLTNSHLSPEELECERHFVETHTRTTSGKYIVRIPLKSSVHPLGEFRTLAQRRMEHLLRKFNKDSTYKDFYLDFMNEFKTLKHVCKISPTSAAPPLMYYIPHHGIVNLKNGIQKIRVVFNCSSRTFMNFSLNDILHTGQTSNVSTDTVLPRRLESPTYRLD